MLAAKARADPPKFGSAERQKVVDEMHNRMLALMEQEEVGGGLGEQRRFGAKQPCATDTYASL